MRARTFSRIATFGVLATALALAACGKDDDQTGKVIATVNGKPIYEGLLQKAMAGIPADLLKTREADIKRQVVDQLVQTEIINQEADKANIEADPAFKQQVDIMARQLKANMLMQRKLESTLSESALRQAYEATKANRSFPAVKARHILVPTEAEANALIAVATPENFSELAKEKSQGPSKDKGGDLGWFRREAMIPEFAAVAFATPVNSVAKTAVKTQFGWHVILVEDRNDKYIPPFEQVAEQLKNELSQQVVQSYLQDLRKGATVTYSDGLEPAAGDKPAAETK